MNRISAVFLATLAVALFATVAVAQQIPKWDPNTVETFSGTVMKEKETGKKGDLEYLLVKPADGPARAVVLGPKRALDPGLTSIQESTTVDVTACKSDWKGRPIWLASSVKVAGKEYKLRDARGLLLDAAGKPVRVKQ
jgi:hypothetical protein